MGKLTFRKAKTDGSRFHDLEGAFKVRHAVYAEEREWVPRTDSGLEIDTFDPFSVQFVAINSSEKVVATARMIYQSPMDLPFQKVCPLPAELTNELLYEVSRLAVLREARGDNSVLLIGICRRIWAHAQKRGYKNWVAVVDEKVCRLLTLLGFKFIYKGESVDHLGSMSVPIICSMEQSGEVLFSPRINKMLEEHLEEVYQDES